MHSVDKNVFDHCHVQSPTQSLTPSTFHSHLHIMQYTFIQITHLNMTQIFNILRRNTTVSEIYRRPDEWLAFVYLFIVPEETKPA